MAHLREIFPFIRDGASACGFSIICKDGMPLLNFIPRVCKGALCAGYAVRKNVKIWLNTIEMELCLRYNEQRIRETCTRLTVGWTGAHGQFKANGKGGMSGFVSSRFLHKNVSFAS